MTATVQEMVAWYRTHQTTAQIGWNPNGMCHKICRTAREVPPLYASAFANQIATPREYRITKVRDLRKGHVVSFDDPADSNKFGHIATLMGRVADYDPDSLHDTLFRTNSVVSGRIVVVRGDYFERYWGDPFVFGAAWINGVELPMEKQAKPKPKPPLGPKGIGRLEHIVDIYTDMIHRQRAEKDWVAVRRLRRDREGIEETIERLSKRGGK